LIVVYAPTYSSPSTKITIYPLVVKVLEGGIEVVTYFWQGAEFAEVAYPVPVELVLPDHYFLGYGKF